jgi:hypothetical protein
LLQIAPPQASLFHIQVTSTIPFQNIWFQQRPGSLLYVDAVSPIVATDVVTRNAAGTLEIRDAAVLIPLAGVAFQGRLRLARDGYARTFILGAGVVDSRATGFSFRKIAHSVAFVLDTPIAFQNWLGFAAKADAVRQVLSAGVVAGGAAGAIEIRDAAIPYSPRRCCLPGSAAPGPRRLCPNLHFGSRCC